MPTAPDATRPRFHTPAPEGTAVVLGGRPTPAAELVSVPPSSTTPDTRGPPSIGAGRHGPGAEHGQHRSHGPAITLAPQTAVSVAMVFHELCTNATKYGALSRDSGTVTTNWEVTQAEGEEWLEIEWVEQGGPPVSPPDRKGFGTRMIERALSADLGAAVALEFKPEGLVCRVRAPLRKVALEPV